MSIVSIHVPIFFAGLKRLPDSDFAHNADKQFSGMDFFDDQMVVITDRSSALNAMTTIIEQGEGNVAVPDSHYSVFVKLYLNRESWGLYNVPKNPKTKDYKGNSRKLNTHGPNTDYIYKVGCLRLTFFSAFLLTCDSS